MGEFQYLNSNMSDHDSSDLNGTENIKPPYESHPSHTGYNNNISLDDICKEYTNKLKSVDLERLFTPHTCWCQTVVRAFILSISVLAPLIKISLTIRESDAEFLKSLFIHSKNMGTFENHAPFCSASFDDFSKSTFRTRSVLNLLKITSLNTFYCPDCGFQKVFNSKAASIHPKEICLFLSPNIIKQAWKCRYCGSDDAFQESLIRIGKNVAAFMVFTDNGVSSLDQIEDQLNPGSQLQGFLNGKFLFKYVVAENNNSFNVYEAVRGSDFNQNSFSWRGADPESVFQGLKLFPNAPFLPNHVRAVIWHHSKPFLLARSLIKKRDISSYCMSHNSAPLTSISIRSNKRFNNENSSLKSKISNDIGLTQSSASSTCTSYDELFQSLFDYLDNNENDLNTKNKS